MAASQRQLHRYIYHRNSKLFYIKLFYYYVKFYRLLLGKGFLKKCKRTEIALNVIQKQ